MNASTKSLPEGYVQIGEINIKNNPRLTFWLSLAAILIIIPTFFLLTSFAARVRPTLLNTSSTITVGKMVILMGAVVLSLTVHELIHGVFFWVFTRSRPVFALHLFYAYSAAPNWYIPARQFMIIALGPLVIMGALGMLLILLVQESWVLLIMIIVALNTGGSAGDLLVLTRLLKLSPGCLVKDAGDIVTFFGNQPADSHP
jgi:hypothetical protein